MSVTNARFLTPKAVADDLDMKISTVYKQCKAGVIPSVRIGGSVRIPRVAYERMLAEQTSQTEGRATTVPAISRERASFDPDLTIEQFKEHYSKSPGEWVEDWRAGRIEDTPEHTRVAIWALALRDAESATASAARVDAKAVF